MMSQVDSSGMDNVVKYCRYTSCFEVMVKSNN